MFCYVGHGGVAGGGDLFGRPASLELDARYGGLCHGSVVSYKSWRLCAVGFLYLEHNPSVNAGFMALASGDQSSTVRIASHRTIQCIGCEIPPWGCCGARKSGRLYAVG